MREIIKADVPNERVQFPKEEGKKLFEQMGEFLKCELIEEKADPVFSAYRTGKFLDFCRGPHIPSTGRIKAVKLLSVAGAHWKGDETLAPHAAHLRDRLLQPEGAGRLSGADRRSQEARPPAAGQGTGPLQHPG